MLIGPALSICAGRPAIYNPASALALQGWWRASYGGSPWVGTASLGASGSRNLNESTNAPAVGAALNGFTPADHDGTNDLLTAAGVSPDYISSTAWSAVALFNADTAVADSALVYTLPQIFAAQSFEIWGLAFSVVGMSLWQHDGTARQRVDVACATGGWRLAQAKWDGSNLKLRLNSGSWSQVACTAFSTLLPSTAPQIGTGASAAFFDGRVAEIMFAQSAFADSTFDSIKSYINNRYGLAL